MDKMLLARLVCVESNRTRTSNTDHVPSAASMSTSRKHNHFVALLFRLMVDGLPQNRGSLHVHLFWFSAAQC